MIVIRLVLKGNVMIFNNEDTNENGVVMVPW